MLPVQVVADGKDISALVESVTFSNVDPGGFEMCSLDPRAGLSLRPGTTIFIRHGGSVAWHGRILDPGEYDKHGHSQRQLGGVGFSHKLDDNPYSMIYVDRDLSRWGEMSSNHRASWLAIGIAPGDVGVQLQPDTATGLPSLLQSMRDAWTAANGARCEALYDAGSGNAIGAIYYDFTIGGSTGTGGSWLRAIYLSNTDNFSGSYDITDVSAVSSLATYATTSSADRRYALLQHGFTVPGGTGGSVYEINWRNVAIYGNHGLSRRGPDPGGFYPSDITLHALIRSGAGFVPQISNADSYVAAHYVQHTPVGASQVIADMAKVMAWHWGVWEPGGLMDNRPTFIFTPPPADATMVIDRYRCDEFEAPRVDYDRLYNVCQVTYTDAAGVSGVVEVSLPDGRLDASGVSRRVLSVDAGTMATAGAAQAFGTFALRLAQRTARSGGSVTMKGDVKLPAGGSMPVALLKAGRDRARLLGLNDGGDLFASDVRSLDTFLVRRVEVTATSDGELSTRVDFDEGVDLMEVLQARLQTAAVVAGSG